jgi:hypothetical protein
MKPDVTEQRCLAGVRDDAVDKKLLGSVLCDAEAVKFASSDLADLILPAIQQYRYHLPAAASFLILPPRFNTFSCH